YAPAIDSGLINYASVYDDTPYTFIDGSYSSLWPHNVNGKYKGLCTIEYAVSHSVNTVAVKILSEYGIGKAYDFLKNELMLDTVTDGEIIDGNLYNDLSLSSLALGGMTYGVTLKDMVSAYSIFPSEGIYKKATSVLKIYDRNGDLIIDNTPKGKRVIEKDTAEIMNQLLKSVVYDEGGTANPYIDRLIGYTEVAGKTGTTSSNIDRWFIGYTPHLASGVWVGYDMNSSLSSVEAGLHVRVFDDIMTEIYEKKEDFYFKEFSKARIVEGSFCMDSGKIVTDSCVCDPRGSRITNGYFKYGDLPCEFCDIHEKVRYCLKGNGVAGRNCPDEDCVYYGMLSYDREMPYDITVTDSEYLYFDI
ncbi:MAG: hypothetical protein MJ072_06670, partial [Clostridia bacterium]|nr:hypothetical protein [Clostridia bacterium]